MAAQSAIAETTIPVAATPIAASRAGIAASDTVMMIVKSVRRGAIMAYSQQYLPA